MPSQWFVLVSATNEAAQIRACQRDWPGSLILSSPLTPIDQAIEICHIATNAILLWVAWHFLWRRARQERLRQDLFELRDQLFDYARSGSIGFSDRAYVLLRTNINSMLRFAHLMSATRIFTFICFQRYLHENPNGELQASFKRALSELKNDEVRANLAKFHEGMYKLIDRLLSRKPNRLRSVTIREKDAAIAIIELQANAAFRAESFKRRHQDHKDETLVAVG